MLSCLGNFKLGSFGSWQRKNTFKARDRYECRKLGPGFVLLREQTNQAVSQNQERCPEKIIIKFVK